MNATHACRVLFTLFLLSLFAQPLHAATVFGTVTGPDGLAANVTIVAEQGGASWETTSDQNGEYSLNLPDGYYNRIYAAPGEGIGLISEVVSNVEVNGSREVRLFFSEEVTLSGKLFLPDWLESEWKQADNSENHAIHRIDTTRAGTCWANFNDDLSFSASCPSGIYIIQVYAPCGHNEILDQSICQSARYFTSVSVDARLGSVSGIEIPEVQPRKPLIGTEPPLASLINIGSADEGGIATITGAPGAVKSLSQISILNTQTGQFTSGASEADGSFSIDFIAPPGSVLNITHDETGNAGLNGSLAPGTLIRAPLEGDLSSFAAIKPAMGPYEGQDIPNVGLQDGGQVWLGGSLDDRHWNQGDTLNLEGEIKIYSRHASSIQLPLTISGDVLLERLFDSDGQQDLANPVFASNALAPTGLPIERRRHRLGRESISIGDIDIGSFSQSGSNSLSATWSATINVPADIPDGTYSLIFEVFDDPGADVVLESYYPDSVFFDNVYTSKLTDSTIFTKTHGTLVTIGSHLENRLTWTIGMNDLSNGSRGTIALEDQDRVAIAGRVTTNSHAFILPNENPKTGQSRLYNLEPFVPLFGTGHRNWMPPHPIPFKFPSGMLSIEVTRPDQTVISLGSKPFAQTYNQELASLGGSRLNPVGIAPAKYFGLTSLDPAFNFSFDQYGKYLVHLDGNIEDIWGNVYQGGGTYELHVAKPLDLETGVFSSTPFEVGDSYSPTVIVQPGVAAQVEIEISHFPNSDQTQQVQQTLSGVANRYGYFFPGQEDSFTFQSPGEYRVKITASYWDEKGALWMGAETWGGVVETPNSLLIAHGARPEVSNSNQWVLLDDLGAENNGLHVPFPYRSGDILWMLDLVADPWFMKDFPTVTVQDTEGTFRQLVEDRAFNILIPQGYLDIGQIFLFSSTPDGKLPYFSLNEPDTHRGYFYASAARPGVRVRDMVSEAWQEESYWQFDDTYLYQTGNGANGDLPNDFKFQFGGAVYRAPDMDYFQYAAYGSLWVLLPNDDPTGGRIMPPFQGNGGGPSGGPIMTLKGKKIDMFLHPMGVRPGSILEVGDVAAFSGQIAPTLESKVWMRVTSPSGMERFVAGTSNKVGYFYDPADNFIVDEPGVWEVLVIPTFEGITSAGQVTEPFPRGDILGSPNGTYHFYVVEKSSEPLEVVIPAHSWVEPGKGPIDISMLPTDELSDVVVHRTTVMPGFLMEEAETSSTTYTYDAPELHKDFPNLDLIDNDSRTGVDTVTMSFLITGVDGGGNTVHRARQVLLQGEELMAPEQAPSFSINSGLNDAWVNSEAANQGMFVTVFPSFELMFAAWFTFDSVAPGGSATLGAPDQRWITALGPYSGTSATLKAELTTGGSFNTSSPTPVQDTNYGTIAMDFAHCNQVDVDYDFPGVGENGSMVMTRAVGSNVGLCDDIVAGNVVPTSLSTAEQAQQLSELIRGSKTESQSAAFTINAGLNDAWANPDANFQGMFLTVFPDLNLMFAAWFTFDSQPSGNNATLGGPDQRWLTALGSYSGTTASLKVENTTGGLFNALDPTPTQDTGYGTLDIDFSDCNNAMVTFELPGAGESGQFSMSRVLNDNVGLCEALGN